MTPKRFIFFMSLASVAIFCGKGESQPQRVAPPEKSGSISGVVLSGAGKPVSGVPVRVGKIVIETDSSGKFHFGKIFVGNRVVTCDVVLSEGGFLGFFARKVRYWGFASGSVEEGKEADMNPTLVRHGDVEATCRSCHPDRPTKDSPHAKCLHRSGIELSPAMVGNVGRYNARNAEAKKEGKEHFPFLSLEERIRKDESVFHVYTCESCHSVHVPAGNLHFVTAPYMERSILCEACH